MRAMDDTFPSNSWPRNAAARITARCPIRIFPRYRWSTSARTRNADKISHDQQRRPQRRHRQFAFLGVDLQDYAVDRRCGFASFTSSARASVNSAWATLSSPSGRVGNGVSGAALSLASVASCSRRRSCARDKPVRAASRSAFCAVPARQSAVILSSADKASAALRSEFCDCVLGLSTIRRCRRRSLVVAGALMQRDLSIGLRPRVPMPPRHRDELAIRRRIRFHWPLTSTSAIRPGTGAAILISPDRGSTRPSVTASQDE